MKQLYLKSYAHNFIHACLSQFIAQVFITLVHLPLRFSEQMFISTALCVSTEIRVSAVCLRQSELITGEQTSRLTSRARLKRRGHSWPRCSCTSCAKYQIFLNCGKCGVFIIRPSWFPGYIFVIHGLFLFLWSSLKKKTNNQNNKWIMSISYCSQC